ncbi:MAG: CotH kinase family protein, partial [Polyangiales bacterium]
MTWKNWLYQALLAVSLATGCASEDDAPAAETPEDAAAATPDAGANAPSDPTESADAAAAADAAEPEIARPAGWDDVSHGRGADADYARLFPSDAVQRIDLTMTPEARQVMLDNLKELLGEPGTGQGFGLQLDETLCADRKTGDACEITEPEAMEGACRSFMPEGKLFCLPKNFGPGGGRMGMDMGGRMGPIDLIGGDPEYVPVTVSYDGKRWEQVGLRYKGNSSLRGAWSSGRLKIGFRLNFDHYEQERPELTDQRFFGFSEMTFSSAYGDSTLIRDKLASEIAAEYGLKTARCAFYRIYVDSGEGPEYWGLYTMIEDPSDELIEAQFDDSSGNMYKPDGPGAYFAEFDEESFAKKT